MPTVSIKKSALLAKLEENYTDEEFDELCFQFGIELDEITNEAAELAKQNKENNDEDNEDNGKNGGSSSNNNNNNNNQKKNIKNKDNKGGDKKSTNKKSTKGDKKLIEKEKEEIIIYKIDVPANRYDLLCIEGIARALRVFLGKDPTPIFRLEEPQNEKTGNFESREKIYVKESTSTIRPYVAGAILRNVEFDPAKYNSFIDLQEHLHRNICRRRTIVAIGTHDLDTIKGPFSYEGRTGENISFLPLTKSTKEDGSLMNAKELLTFYRTDVTCKHLKPYTGIIYDFPMYPVIYDSTGTVLSLPPIINGDHSRISLDTKNIFIECTGTDHTKVGIVLDIIVTMFSEYCAKPFTIEPVEVIYEAKENGMNNPEIFPKLSQREERASMKEIYGYLGLTPKELTPEDTAKLCNKMQLGPSHYDAEKDEIVSIIPPTRSDILHAVDIIEDVAIAYGFNDIPESLPPTYTIGKPLPLNNICDNLRIHISQAGYLEMLTHGLCSRADCTTSLRRPDPMNAVVLSNPQNIEYEIVRTSLIPGLLKTVEENNNLSVKQGLKLFEISDVVIQDHTTETGSRNCRHLAALYAGPTSGFEIIHGLADRIMTLLQIGPTNAYAGNSKKKSEEENATIVKEDFEYSVVQNMEDGMFFDGRGASLVFVDRRSSSSSQTNNSSGQSNIASETIIGSFGVLHPEVLKNYGITDKVVSVLEINLQLIAEL